MYQIIKSEERYHFDGGWLSTHWHFSFDHYYDPDNIQFGPLRVFNDDYIQPHSGFPMHPHREMEIVTYVIEGELTHEDNLGNKGTIRAGEVQRMTAGRGIVHSESNQSDQIVHLLQIWVVPAESKLAPSWEQKQFTKEQRKGVLLPIVSGEQKGEALHIHQDATFYVSSLESGDRVSHTLKPGRRAYLFVIDGSIDAGGHSLSSGDQARITEETEIEIVASEASELILIDLP
ncbi:MAG: pirin family protein [Bacillaceae bacterium]|nr:pirin family protein [Bacillaceae bacterium]